MIKNIKLFVNNNDKSINTARIVKENLINNGFIINDDKFDLGIAIGGDGSFLRMIKQCNFNSNPYYVGINAGTLGFLQEVKLEEIDKFIKELKNNEYKIENIGIQETTINHEAGISKYLSLNEIVVRWHDLKKAQYKVLVDDSLLEYFAGDGLLVSTSLGSTAHNLSYGGAIIFSDFHALQITPMGPINTSSYRTLFYPTIVPPDKSIVIKPINGREDLIITIDGENKYYNGVDSISTTIKDKKIKCLKLNNYNYPNKIYDKILAGK